MNCSKKKSDSYYELALSGRDLRLIHLEREKAKKIKRSHFWQNRLKNGVCYYCEKKFLSHELTMDHIVPLARGGKSTLGNLAPACKECNQSKKLDTPVDQLLRALAQE